MELEVFFYLGHFKKSIYNTILPPLRHCLLFQNYYQSGFTSTNLLGLLCRISHTGFPSWSPTNINKLMEKGTSGYKRVQISTHQTRAVLEVRLTVDGHRLLLTGNVRLLASMFMQFLLHLILCTNHNSVQPQTTS